MYKCFERNRNFLPTKRSMRIRSIVDGKSGILDFPGVRIIREAVVGLNQP